MSPCLLCKRDTETKTHVRPHNKVPICSRCGACKCESCVREAKAESRR